MESVEEINQLLAEAEEELTLLESRWGAVLNRIQELRSHKGSLLAAGVSSETTQSQNLVTNESPSEDKIALFMTLFSGRRDVYPRRFESKRTGKSGYQPACRNEWIRGRCRPPPYLPSLSSIGVTSISRWRWTYLSWYYGPGGEPIRYSSGDLYGS